MFDLESRITPDRFSYSLHVVGLVAAEVEGVLLDSRMRKSRSFHDRYHSSRPEVEEPAYFAQVQGEVLALTEMKQVVSEMGWGALAEVQVWLLQVEKQVWMVHLSDHQDVVTCHL